MNSTLQSLNALDDIILPPDIGVWPIAYGWWLLIFISISVISFLLWLLIKTLKKKRVLNNAYAELLKNTDHLHGNELCAAINHWLKLKSRHHWPHSVTLHGKEWVDFLNTSAHKSIFTGLDAQSLSEGPYLESIWASRVDLQQLAFEWYTRSKAYQNRRPT